MVLQKTLESPLDSKEIKPVNPKGNQSWIFIGRTDAEAETPLLWPPDGQSWLWVEWHHSMDMSLSKLQDMVKDREAWHGAVYGVTKSGTWLSNWTATITTKCFPGNLNGARPASLWGTLRLRMVMFIKRISLFTFSFLNVMLCESLFLDLGENVIPSVKKSWSFSHVLLFVDCVAHQVPLSMEFSGQEYASRLPFPSP